jgi:tRNA threonylcarbamoyl adenosine modification protein (Sua5/YciO/YrdC/YwlC family)
VSDAEAFERCMAVGGVAVFPSDTVYGLACDVANRVAVERLYLLKRRARGKPSAVMFFDLDTALEAVPELGERTREAMRQLLPGPVGMLVSNPAQRFPLACGEDPLTLGLRVPAVGRLQGVRWPILQSSANLAGGADPTLLEEVPEVIRAAADLVIDGGELPGTPSTVVDVRSYDEDGSWSVVREGAVQADALAAVLGGQFHFDPASYLEMMQSEVPSYERLHEELVGVSGGGAKRILELGTGTGETAARLLARHPDASLVGIDKSESMLDAARDSLPPARVELRVGRIEDELPDGSFDLVASALCVHHLDAGDKADLFRRVRAVLAPGGRFVLADVVVPERASDAVTPLTPGFDKPSSLAEQLAWLRDAGFDPAVRWSERDLAVLVGLT